MLKGGQVGILDGPVIVGNEAVDTGHLVPFIKQSTTQVGANKSGCAGNQVLAHSPR